MIVDAHTLDNGHTIEADVCIVGAGAAGITLAMELSGQGLTVALLESGGTDWEADANALNRGQNTSDWSNTACRGRLLGGSTNLWGGWCRPLDPEDFAVRDWISDVAWPFGREEMDPFYARAHETTRIGATDYDVQGAAERLGHELFPTDESRVTSVLYQYSAPVHFGSVYRDELTDAEDLTLYLHANVLSVVLNESEDAVASLDVGTYERGEISVVAGRYILAMGGIENPRVLLHSDVGNANDLVGRYFQEHPHFTRHYLLTDEIADGTLYAEKLRTLTFDDANPDGKDIRVRSALSLPRSVQESEQLLPLAFTFKPVEIDGEEPEGIGAQTMAALLPNRLDGAALWRVWVRCEQRPLRESRVMLNDEETDSFGIRRVIVDWKVDEQDMADYRRTLEMIGAELGRLGLGLLWIPVDEDGVINDALEGGCHHMGTTRMHPDPESGVVNEDCRVHGIDNLYCAGSSVFPTSGFANPTLTIVALAHRLADHILEL